VNQWQATLIDEINEMQRPEVEQRGPTAKTAQCSSKLPVVVGTHYKCILDGPPPLLAAGVA
jgi:hypothetical protein